MSQMFDLRAALAARKPQGTESAEIDPSAPAPKRRGRNHRSIEEVTPEPSSADGVQDQETKNGNSVLEDVSFSFEFDSIESFDNTRDEEYEAVLHEEESDGPLLPAAVLQASPYFECTENDLFLKFRNTQDSDEKTSIRNAIMERYVDLVEYIATRLHSTLPASVQKGDLVQHGSLGLMQAVEGFDPDRGVKFKTYAATRIRGAMLDGLREDDWVPRLVRLERARLDRQVRKLTGLLEREPTHHELARSLGLTYEELTQQYDRADIRALFSLTEKWEDHSDEDGLEKGEVLMDQSSLGQAPDTNLVESDSLNKILSHLHRKERMVVQLHFLEGYPLSVIGQQLGVTESRACQLKNTALHRLKSMGYLTSVRRNIETRERFKSFNEQNGRKAPEQLDAERALETRSGLADFSGMLEMAELDVSTRANGSRPNGSRNGTGPKRPKRKSSTHESPQRRGRLSPEELQRQLSPDERSSSTSESGVSFDFGES